LISTLFNPFFLFGNSESDKEEVGRVVCQVRSPVLLFLEFLVTVANERDPKIREPLQQADPQGLGGARGAPQEPHGFAFAAADLHDPGPKIRRSGPWWTGNTQDPAPEADTKTIDVHQIRFPKYPSQVRVFRRQIGHRRIQVAEVEGTLRFQGGFETFHQLVRGEALKGDSEKIEFGGRMGAFPRHGAAASRNLECKSVCEKESE
jgi:hypothetical protein